MEYTLLLLINVAKRFSPNRATLLCRQRYRRTLLTRQHWVSILVTFLVENWHIILFRVNSLREGFLLLVH